MGSTPGILEQAEGGDHHLAATALALDDQAGGLVHPAFLPAWTRAWKSQVLHPAMTWFGITRSNA